MLPLRYRGRVCVDETTTATGRAKCLKWEPASRELIAEYTLWLPKPDPSPGRRERSEMRLLTDTIKTQGALTGFQEEGKFYWLVRRLVEDLRGYLTQPHNPGMCSGAPTMVTFYRSQMLPLQERIARLRQIESRAQKRAQSQLARLTKALIARVQGQRDAIQKAAARKIASAKNLATPDDIAGLDIAYFTPPALPPLPAWSDEKAEMPADVEAKIFEIVGEQADPGMYRSIKTGSIFEKLADARLVVDQLQNGVSGNTAPTF